MNHVLAFGARNEALAMTGHLDVALSGLDSEAKRLTTQGLCAEAAWIRMKGAEAWHNDMQEQEAWHILEQYVAPGQQALPVPLRSGFLRNQQFLALLLGKMPQPETSHGIEIEKLAQADAGHLQSLLEAERASRERKHYESLPPLWRALRQAYQSGHWGTRQAAHRRLAWETLAAGWGSESTHHAILGGEERCIDHLAQTLITWNSVDATTKTVTWVLCNCHLARHTESAARLLQGIADIIPDDQFSRVSNWLMQAVNRPALTRERERCACAAWKALEHVSYRFNPSQAAAILDLARSHAFLQQKSWGREALLRTMYASLYRATDYDWTALANRLIPLATTERWDVDYQVTLQLLAKVAQRSPEAHDCIRNTLVPKGTPFSDLKLATEMGSLGGMLDPADVRRVTNTIARRLPLQVWTGSGTPPPFTLSQIMTQSSVGSDETIRIAMMGGGVELDFIAAWQKTLTPGDLQPLVQVALDLIQHPINVRTNRIMLIQFIEEIHEQLTVEEAQRALEILWRVAMGTGPVSPAEIAQTATTDRFRMEGPSAAEEQSAALMAAMTIEERVPPSGALDHHRFLRDALVHKEPPLRRSASIGVTRIRPVTEDLALALITTLQDPDPVVAVTAFGSVLRLLERGELAAQTALLSSIAQRTIRSPNANVRGLTVRLARAMLLLPLGEEEHQATETIVTRASRDLHYSVRIAAKVSDE